MLYRQNMFCTMSNKTCFNCSVAFISTWRSVKNLTSLNFPLLQFSTLMWHSFLQACRVTALTMVKPWCAESYTEWSNQRTHGTDLHGDNTTPVIPSSAGTGEGWERGAASGMPHWYVQQARSVLCPTHHPVSCPCWLMHKGETDMCPVLHSRHCLYLIDTKLYFL